MQGGGQWKRTLSFLRDDICLNKVKHEVSEFHGFDTGREERLLLQGVSAKQDREILDTLRSSGLAGMLRLPNQMVSGNKIQGLTFNVSRKPNL